jgi:adenosine deaminase
MEAFIRALPKAELHVHLEGSIVPELALRLAARRGVRLPGHERGVDGLREAYVFRSFGDFLTLYMAVSSCIVEPEDLAEAGADLGRRLAAQNVRYAEVTFTPMTHVVRGVPKEKLWDGLLQGRARAAEEHGVQLRWVFDVVRSFPDQAEDTMDFALAMRQRDPQGVVGVGVGGPEADHYRMDAIARAFARARAEGLRSLPHAGENAGAASIWIAVRELGADRIGHGVRCLEDPALVEHLRERGIVLEVCPGSNVALGVVKTLQAHPLPRLLAAGLRVTLGSDDPPMFGTDLHAEYCRCAAAFGWDQKRVRALADASFAASFAEADAVAGWRAEVAAVNNIR